ncbi:MAG TPA: formate--tetrahydrofolate ligase, partial [Vibrio sp.]|nr:formate--tetrahydrofolate ligase [Vibrio sp.]
MLSDIDICRSTPLKNISEVAKQAGLQHNEHQPLGQYKSKVSLTSLERLANQQDGKLVVVTAITPTPLGEGKTVTTIGLAQGL